jgi:hypothetical protein
MLAWQTDHHLLLIANAQCDVLVAPTKAGYGSSK